LPGVCGICGIVSAGAPVDPERLAAMSRTLVHRGPDTKGAFIDGAAGLAA
jgi:asparagine synthase (glutamine-hydrolysing)